ncbi:hypothetical protein KYT24_004379 [Salmonella enterica]|nr:hypothetical protein [Salmonella enterica]
MSELTESEVLQAIAGLPEHTQEAAYRDLIWAQGYRRMKRSELALEFHYLRLEPVPENYTPNPHRFDPANYDF